MFSEQTERFYRGRPEHGDWHKLGMYHALVEARVPFDMVHDRFLDPERLAQYDLLVLPNIAALDESQCDALRAFVARGGSLIATFETSLYDEWGVPRPDFGLADLFGVSFAGRVEGPLKNSYLTVNGDAGGQHHPILRGLEDADRIINGIWRLDVAAERRVPVATDAGAELPGPTDGGRLPARADNRHPRGLPARCRRRPGRATSRGTSTGRSTN